MTDAFEDELMFADEEEPNTEAQTEQTWKVLIADDEEEVHRVTKMVLEGITFDSRKVEFIEAYSGEETMDLMTKHQDVALIFLDVVMETDDAGLRVARRIREELGNTFVRIILRTGQPGQAPEDKVIVDYDINDYKLKTELTSTRLFTTVVTALRSYQDIMTIEHNKRCLKKIIDGSPKIFKRQSMLNFTRHILDQANQILNLETPDRDFSGFAANRENGVFYIRSALGDYDQHVNQKAMDVAPSEVRDLLVEALGERRSVYRDLDFVGYLEGSDDRVNLIYVHTYQELSIWDRDLMEIFFTNIQTAYENIILNKEIEETQAEVLYTLGEIAETRSKETGNHVRRVAEFSELLALKYGLSEEEAGMLKKASPMHDVGKLGIPDSILNKPARLDPEEWEIMKTHATIGYEMLKKSTRPLMQAAAIVAGEHHEKWDGSGYPKGSKGEDIHIFGRITALADVFDALSVRRVYKKAWPIEKVRNLLVEESGKHFEPKLVDILLENLDAFLEIRHNYTDPWEREE